MKQARRGDVFRTFLYSLAASGAIVVGLCIGLVILSALALAFVPHARVSSISALLVWSASTTCVLLAATAAAIGFMRFRERVFLLLFLALLAAMSIAWFWGGPVWPLLQELLRLDSFANYDDLQLLAILDAAVLGMAMAFASFRAAARMPVLGARLRLRPRVPTSSNDATQLLEAIAGFEAGEASADSVRACVPFDRARVDEAIERLKDAGRVGVSVDGRLRVLEQ